MTSPICLIKSKTEKLCILIRFLVTQKNIIKQTLNIINERLNKRLSNKKKFLKTKHDYELIVEKFSYNDKLKFEKYIAKN